MEIIGIDEVMKTYGLPKAYATKLLNKKGCPVLPRARGQKYRVLKEQFGEWLASQTK